MRKLQYLVLYGFIAIAFAACGTTEASLPSLCEGVDCGGHGQCVLVGPDEAACVCEPGYAAQGLACVVGEDACTGVDCDGHGLCIMAGGSPTCLCGDGYVSSGASCVEPTSPCAGVSCSGHGACVVSSAGMAACLCDVGFVRDGTDCVALADACAEVSCGAHGGCVVTASGPRCLCEPGFEGEECAPVVDVCAEQGCGEHGRCVDASGEAACLCEAGYAVEEGVCVPATEDPNPCDAVQCGPRGVCAVAAGGPLCVCEAGFVYQDGTCKAQADPCETVDCDGHGVCAVAGANAVCVCDGGFVSQGASCVAGPNPCAGIDCGGKGVCVASPEGEPVCVCYPGYDSDGADCVPSAIGSDACQGVTCGGHGSCVVSGSGAALCLCDEGFYPQTTDCLPNIDPCSTTDCGEHGSCFVTAAGPACLCGQGYVSDGATCIPVAGDACFGLDCSGYGACVVAAGAATCLCEPGYHAQGTACVADIDPCESVYCSGFGGCVVTSTGVACLCETGYRAIGLECLPDPADAIPETFASDLDSIVDHPVESVPYVPNELLVYAAEGHDATAFRSFVTAQGVEIGAYKPASLRYELRFPSPTSFTDFDAKATAIRESEYVSAATELWVVEPAVKTPEDTWDDTWNESDPDGDNWYLEMIGAPSAWSVSTGPAADPIRVGVIDGDFTKHEDLVPNLGTMDLGYSYYGPIKYDKPDHGTKVAGLIAARGNNGKGLTGVLWTAQIAYCALDMTDKSIFNCMERLLQRGVHVINLSSAYSAPLSVEKRAATAAAWRADLNRLSTSTGNSDWVLVQAAGNDSLADASWEVPAMAIDDAALRARIVVVGAVGTDPGEFACYSNRGAVDIVAPGGDAAGFGACGSGPFGLSGTDMRVLSGLSNSDVEEAGTSFAAPLVAGTIALAWSLMPEWSAATAVQATLAGSGMGPNGLPLLDAAGAVQVAVNACANKGGAIDPATGRCATGCIADCTGKACGADDGCGAACFGVALRTCVGDVLHACDGKPQESTFDCASIGKVCGWSESYQRLQCVSAVCTPSCVGKQCGGDGCGGTCSPGCGVGLTCNASGACVQAGVSEGFVSVPAGSFWMGSSSSGMSCPDGYTGGGCKGDGTGSALGELGRGSDESLHFVTLTTPFEIMATEVTQGQWKAMTGGWNPSSFSSCGDDCPVETVNWYEATWYANALSAQEGMTPCYDYWGTTCQDGTTVATPDACMNATNGGVKAATVLPKSGATPYGCTGYRLPTEAEWEYAYRAGSQTAFYLTPGFDGSIEKTDCSLDPNAARIAWYCWDAGSTTHEVAQKYPNAFGTYDMAGNVYEWCWDWYQSSYSAGSVAGPNVDPGGPSSGSFRVLRGGGWYDFASGARGAYRYYYTPGYRFYGFGFRLARSL